VPTYGDNKKRDMARSILPSTMRGGQKSRRLLHKRVRLQERVELRVADGDPDLGVADRNRAHGTHDFVQHRRIKDKVGPFSRWAERVTKDLPKENRLPHLRALLPNTLIGEHALSHVEWKSHFDASFPGVGANNNTHHTSRSSSVDKDVEWVRAQLRCDLNFHTRLNRALKAAHRTTFLYWRDGRKEAVGPTRARTLSGFHDVEAFMRDLHSANNLGNRAVHGDFNPDFHHRIRYGNSAGAFWVPTGEYHPEWLGVLRELWEATRLAG